MNSLMMRGRVYSLVGPARLSNNDQDMVEFFGFSGV